MRKYVVVAALSAAMVLLGTDSAWARHRGCGGRRHHGGCGCYGGGGGCYGGCGGGYAMGCGGGYGGGCGGGYAMGHAMGGWGMGGGGMGYAALTPYGGTQWALDGQPTFFAPVGWVWSTPVYQQAVPTEIVSEGESQPIPSVWVVSD